MLLENLRTSDKACEKGKCETRLLPFIIFSRAAAQSNEALLHKTCPTCPLSFYSPLHSPGSSLWPFGHVFAFGASRKKKQNWRIDCDECQEKLRSAFSSSENNNFAMAIAISLPFSRTEMGSRVASGNGFYGKVRACKNYNQFSLKQAQVLAQAKTTKQQQPPIHLHYFTSK